MDDTYRQIRVGYQGIPGAYSEEALVAFQEAAEPVSFRTLPDLFAALTEGVVDRAFVPVENSQAGSVVEAYDLMLDHKVTILAEWIQPIHHYLLGIKGASPASVERVYSHPQALAQSAAFIRQAQLDTEPYYDTAGAAQMVSERGDQRYAAVASRLAGERYGLSVLAEGIQTAKDNATRFFLLTAGSYQYSPAASQEDRPGKTTLVFSVAHRPGALVRALSCFAREQVNLERLESRPSRREPWQYMFFTDAAGYAYEPPVRKAIRELTRLNPFVRVLGSYPAAQMSAAGPGDAS
jgi:prephenate dehydratase/chorismate mutase/prephenate dehydratase